MQSHIRSIELCQILTLAALGAALPACMEGPENGDLNFNPTETGVYGLQFTGKHDKPGEQIRIQVRKAPDSTADTSWVTIGTAVSGTTPNYWNQPEPYYSWSIGALPVPSPAFAARWPQGGILRFRALDSANKQLATFDQDRYECFLANASSGWMAAGLACESSFPVAAVVSVSPTPADLATPPKFLSFQTINCSAAQGNCPSPAEADLYYGVTNAAPNLPSFKQEYGFGAAGSDEATATYFNFGDLDTGREMHCKSFQKPGMASPGRVCYVSNYGDGTVNFGGNPATAVARAVNGAKSGVHAGAFATVTMAYYPPISADNSVRFAVYGANGQRVNEAQLDSKGFNKGIPQSCITCHGGGQYDYVNHRVRGASSTQNGARFLAFDVDQFSYSTEAGYTLAAQQESFRKLNQHVYNAAPALATKELIEGWYAQGSVSTPGTTADTSFIPATFSDTLADRKIYKDVVAPYCRGCHVAQRGTLSMVSSLDFKALGSAIDFRTCVVGQNPSANHLMPNAEATMKRFWASPARAYLAGYLNLNGSCKP